MSHSAPLSVVVIVAVVGWVDKPSTPARHESHGLLSEPSVRRVIEGRRV